MVRPDEPQAASSIEGSIHFIILAASVAMRPYSVAVFISICHQPSISLPRHQNLMSCGLSQPCLRRRSESAVPLGWLQYSTRLRAASPPRVPRLTASIGSMSAARHQSMNSLVPKVFGSVDIQARSSRRGRSFDRADAVLPVVAGDEIAARIAHDGGRELAHHRQHVLAEALLVGLRVAGLVDAAIDAAAEMLDEGAEQPPVGRADHVVAVEFHCRFGIALSSG